MFFVTPGPTGEPAPGQVTWVATEVLKESEIGAELDGMS